MLVNALDYWAFWSTLLASFVTIRVIVFSTLGRSHPAAPSQFDSPEGPPDCLWLLGDQSLGLESQDGGQTLRWLSGDEASTVTENGFALGNVIHKSTEAFWGMRETMGNFGALC